MLLGTRKTLYDHIMELLLEKETNVPDISTCLERLEVKATIQGIYKALRELIAEDIVVKQKKLYSINSVWRSKASNLLREQYRFKLSPGEEVAYRFNKIAHLDAFWKHTLNDIQKEIGTYPTFAFLPHQFWYFIEGRTESEIEYEEAFSKEKIFYFSVIGADTLLDRNIKTTLENKFHQISLQSKSSFSRRDHVSVMKDYVITTRISKHLAQEIDKLYDIEKDLVSFTEKLHTLLKRPDVIQMIVVHNQKKALALRRTLSKTFYIPKEIQNEFDVLRK